MSDTVRIVIDINVNVRNGMETGQPVSESPRRMAPGGETHGSPRQTGPVPKTRDPRLVAPHAREPDRAPGPGRGSALRDGRPVEPSKQVEMYSPPPPPPQGQGLNHKDLIAQYGESEPQWEVTEVVHHDTADSGGVSVPEVISALIADLGSESEALQRAGAYLQRGLEGQALYDAVITEAHAEREAASAEPQQAPQPVQAPPPQRPGRRIEDEMLVRSDPANSGAARFEARLKEIVQARTAGDTGGGRIIPGYRR